MSTAVRVVLHHEVTLEAVGVLSWREDWNTVALSRKGELPEREVWQTKNGDTVITFLGDHITGLRYLVIDGAQQESVLDLVTGQFPCWTHEEALDFLSQARDRDEKIHGIYLSAVSAPFREGGRLAADFREASADPDPDVRHALLVAIGYLGSWPSLRELAASMRSDDPDDGVRRDAGYLLEGLELDAVHGGGTSG
ncbi:HEAT repeat domain-containing protein [Streptomyces sp. NPDC052051]|uniref:HEAT repeat domain-containing protein n=1 Tax=Streptomyces sp. NPDC052051 TaxID=3154649 RepID=UPI0034276507